MKRSLGRNSHSPNLLVSKTASSCPESHTERCTAPQLFPFMLYCQTLYLSHTCTIFSQEPSVTSCTQDPSTIRRHTTEKFSLHPSVQNLTFQIISHLLHLLINNHSPKFPLCRLDTFSPNPALSSSLRWRSQSHLQYPDHESWGPVPSPAVCRPSPHLASARTP